MAGQSAHAKSMRIIRVALAALLVLTVLACYSCGTPSLKPETRAKLSEAVDDVMSRYGVPGAMAGAWVAEAAWVGTEGEANTADGEAMRPADKFRIGSITKTFVATVVLQLADEGKLALEDPLEKYVTGFPNGGGIVIRQLLNMTSGIYNYTDDENFWTAVETDPMRKWSPNELVDIAASHEPYFPPGGGWMYSNTNYILLGMIIEKVTGNDVEGELKKRVIDKLGLKATSFPTGPEITGPYAHGYLDDPKTGKLKDVTGYDPSHAWTAGAMISNLYDLRTWVEALADGRLLSKKAHGEQMTWVDTGMPFVSYGLGVFKLNDYVGHGGSIFGYNSAMFTRSPEKKTVVCMVNKDPVDEEGRAVAMVDLFGDIYPALAGENAPR